MNVTIPADAPMWAQLLANDLNRIIEEQRREIERLNDKAADYETRIADLEAGP